MATSNSNAAAFQEGVRVLFTNWWVLRTAVEYGWGGHESESKAEWFINSVVEYFGTNGKKVDVFDIEEVLAGVMNTEFQTLLEDDSSYEVAKELYELYQGCIKGDYAKLEELKRRYPAVNIQFKTISLSDCEDEDGECEDGDEEDTTETDPSRLSASMMNEDVDMAIIDSTPTVDPEGWEKVKGHKRRH